MLGRKLRFPFGEIVQCVFFCGSCWGDRRKDVKKDSADGD